MKNKPVFEIGNTNWAVKDGVLLGYGEGDAVKGFLPQPLQFERGTNLGVTRVNKDGLVEKGRQNLIQLANNLNNWSNTSLQAPVGYRYAVEGGYEGYDKKKTAWLINKNVAINSYMFAPNAASASGVWTFSIYAKRGSLDGIFLYTGAGTGTTGQATFDLTNGTVFAHSTLITGGARIEDVGNGWYRCSITSETATTNRVRIQPVRPRQSAQFTSKEDATGTIYVQYPQLEVGVAATPVIGTTSTTNLLRNSNDPESWDTNSLIITQGQLGYDGSHDAIKMHKTAKFGRLRQIVVPTIQYGKTVTYSVYARRGVTLNGLHLRLDYESDGSDHDTLNFDLDGIRVVGSEPSWSGFISRKAEFIGDGWGRYSVTFTTRGSLHDVRIYGNEVRNGSATFLHVDDTDSDDDPVQTGSIYIQHPQLEYSEEATAFSNNSEYSGLRADTPLIDYTDSDGYLLMEPSRENKVKYSEYYDHSTWDAQSRSNNLVWRGNEENPSGYNGCYEYESTAADNQLGVASSTNLAPNPADGDYITNSIYVKRVSGTGQVILRDTNNIGTNFDVTVADGWKRLIVSAAADASTPDGIGSRHYLNLATIGDKVLVWGSQYEEGAFATSYIPTHGAAVTRSAAGTPESGGAINDLSAVFDGTNFTLFVHLADNDDLLRDNSSGGLSLWDGNNQVGGLRIYRNQSSTVKAHVLFDPTSGDDFGYELDGDKAIIRRSGSAWKIFVDGAQTQSFTNVNFDANLNDLKIETGGSTFKWKGVKLFNEALTDEECKTLTT
jgi:hypothetical protein